MSNEQRDTLDRRLRELSPGIEPPRDLWPAIAAELEPRTVPPANLTAMTPSAQRAAFGPSHALDAEYVKARAQLAKMLDERIGRLPPSARKKVEFNLAEMRRAADEINRALATSPGDPLLEELLLTTYQEELAVLASVNQLATSAGADQSAGATAEKGIDL
jgi:hypothetical protein